MREDAGERPPGDAGDKDGATPRSRREPTYRIPPDEEVVAALVRVLLKEGTVTSQRRLHALVAEALRDRNEAYLIAPERVRALALRSGVVGLRIRARVNGATPPLSTCPVCGAKLSRAENRTLQGATAQTGYRCSRCPYWTGRDYRIPQQYTFVARVEKDARESQTRLR